MLETLHPKIVEYIPDSDEISQLDPTSPLFAITKAIRFAVGQKADFWINAIYGGRSSWQKVQRTPNIFRDDVDLHETIIESTRGACHDNSAKSLLCLFKEFSELFDEFYFIESDSSVSDYADYRGFKNGQNWGVHVYGVVKDKNGLWYGFSPAYYEGADNPITLILRGTSFEDLMCYIQDKDGGYWPASEKDLDIIPDRREKKIHLITTSAYGTSPISSKNSTIYERYFMEAQAALSARHHYREIDIRRMISKFSNP
jgi:hypothetical protein